MRNALVFGGGGGKGAYEIGVWRALREMGAEKNFSCVLGTSVGALNAALFAQKALDNAEYIWRNITPKTILTDNWGKGEAFASQDGLRQLLLRYVSLMPSDLSVYVCCSRVIAPPETPPFASDFGVLRPEGLPYPGAGYFKPFGVNLAETYQPEYFHLNRLTKWEQVQCLMASAALPFAFDAVEINGAAYRDGGFRPEDNLPYRKAASLGYTRILAVSLDSGVVHELSCGNARVLVLYPSVSLGDAVSGTLDFEASGADWRMRLGYQDTMSRRETIYAFLDVSTSGRKNALTLAQQERLRQIFRNP